MPSYNLSTRGRLADIGLGIRVDRATDNILTSDNLFTVATGNVLVTLILGEVTTTMETKVLTFKLQANPTTGTTTDLCATLDLSADEVGALYTITGDAATDAMQRGESGSVPAQTTAVVVAPVTIDAVVGATHTGSIKWSIWYLPLEDGAYIEAAAGA